LDMLMPVRIAIFLDSPPLFRRPSYMIVNMLLGVSLLLAVRLAFLMKLNPTLRIHFFHHGMPLTYLTTPPSITPDRAKSSKRRAPPPLAHLFGNVQASWPLFPHAVSDLGSSLPISSVKKCANATSNATTAHFS
jgi:hypothetical protein